MGWLRVAYNLTVGELYKKGIEQIQVQTNGLQMPFMKGVQVGAELGLTQPLREALPQERLGRLALAPEAPPELIVIPDDLADAA